MSKAEKFIREHTRNCSNEFEPQKAPPSVYNPWLTPDDAKEAVEIAREELVENMQVYIKSMISDITFSDIDGNDNYDLNKFIDDLKQAMKDE